MLQKNQQLNAICTTDHLGTGETMVGGIPLLVSEWISGESADILVVKVGKKRAFGKLLSVTRSSEHRVKPPCPIARQCGGCDLQHLSVPEQLIQKQAFVKTAFSAYPELSEVEVLPILASPADMGYRNKAQFAVRWTPEGVHIGLYAKRSIRVINTPECLIQDPQINALLDWHHQFFAELHVEYSAESWPINHLVMRSGTAGLMAALVTPHQDLPFIRKWVALLSEAFPKISLYLNTNDEPGNVVLGPKSRHLSGPTEIVMKVNDCDYQVGLETFFQSNSKQVATLFNEMLSQSQLTGNERVIDLYCGVGAMTLQLAKQAGHVVGVESLEASVKAAKANAELNGITNVSFLSGEAEELLFQCGLCDVVVMDPPRKGCHPNVLSILAQLKPKRIVYVSCNPETLARDAAVLVTLGYGLTKVQPVEMFPHAAHIEVVASFIPH